MVSEYSHCRRVAGAVGQVQHTDLAQHVHVTATDALLAFRHPEADTHMKKIKKKIDFGICTQVGSIQGSKRQFSVCPLQHTTPGAIGALLPTLCQSRCLIPRLSIAEEPVLCMQNEFVLLNTLQEV